MSSRLKTCADCGRWKWDLCPRGVLTHCYWYFGLLSPFFHNASSITEMPSFSKKLNAAHYIRKPKKNTGSSLQQNSVNLMQQFDWYNMLTNCRMHTSVYLFYSCARSKDESEQKICSIRLSVSIEHRLVIDIGLQLVSALA